MIVVIYGNAVIPTISDNLNNNNNTRALFENLMMVLIKNIK